MRRRQKGLVPWLQMEREVTDECELRKLHDELACFNGRDKIPMEKSKRREFLQSLLLSCGSICGADKLKTEIQV